MIRQFIFPVLEKGNLLHSQVLYQCSEMQMVEIFQSISEVATISKGNRISVEAAVAVMDMFWAVLCHY